MAVRSIFSVDISDAKFREFKKLFDTYDKALKSQPAAWALVTKNINGSKASYETLVSKMAAANVQQKLLAKAQETADRMTRTTAERWASIAKSTREFSRNITSATASLVKWASVTGAISGLIGAGGLFGIDRLAIGAAGARRSALGLGTNIGSQAAFNANFGRLIDPQSFLENVAGARFDVNKRTGLLAAGLSANQIDHSDTTQLSVALLRSLKKMAETTNPALYAQILSARRLDQFASPLDLERLRNTGGAEFEQLLKQFGDRQRQFDLTDKVARQWQDLTTQLDNAGKAIETTLIRGLVGLAPGLSKLSDSITKVIGTLLTNGGPVEKWMDKLGKALEQFASYVGTPEFQESVKQFVDGIEVIAEKIAGAIKWFASPERQASVGAQQDRVDALRRERASGKVSAFQQLSRIFKGEVTPDYVLAAVREKEGGTTGRTNAYGAIGEYQIKRGTAIEHGINPDTLYTEEGNKAAARKILSDYIKRYNGNFQEVLAAYNQGTHAGDRFHASGDNPASLKPEGQKYIQGSGGIHVTVTDNTGGAVNTSVNALKN